MQAEATGGIGALAALGIAEDVAAHGSAIERIAEIAQEHMWLLAGALVLFLLWRLSQRRGLWDRVIERRVTDAATGAHRGR